MPNFITIDRDSDKPLYAQIRDAIFQAIESSTLRPGDQLPTVNSLAKQLGVTQSTIRRAFEDLTQKGILGCHVGRGTFVQDPEQIKASDADSLKHKPERKKAPPRDPEFRSAARRMRMGIEKSLDALNILAQRPGLINFTQGVPDPAIARKGILKELALQALETDQVNLQTYSPPGGFPELREKIAKYMTQKGMQVSRDQVMITNGSQQAIALLAQYALENQYRIICETPCYMGIAKAFGAIGHWVESVQRDMHGPVIEKLNRYDDQIPSMIYLCSILHNPMGTDISPQRLNKVVNWAKDQQALIISDEIFRDLYYEGASQVNFFNTLGPEQSIVVGSFSKSFMCGLRIGWLITSRERIQSLTVLKRAMDIGCPPLMQRIALCLLESGEYEKHLTQARAHYATRRNAIIKALKQHMPDQVAWTVPSGGFHLWVELPAGYSSIVLFLLAIERGVSFHPGPQMDIDHRFINAFRLSFGALEITQIKEGIELLADAARELLKDPPSEPGLSGLGDFI